MTRHPSKAEGDPGARRPDPRHARQPALLPGRLPRVLRDDHRNLGEAGLIYSPQQETPWSRVVIEKPFGHDLAERPRLEPRRLAVLDESQVYRIDHYLGKETVQNILALRFGNSIFEPIWNRRHVSSVQITVAEEVGMAGGRGAYYDTAGAIRDMVQNHMMQLLCLVAMEPPVDLSADAVRNEKVKVLQALPALERRGRVSATSSAPSTPAGSIEGTEVPGYLAGEGGRARLEDRHLRRDPADAEQLAVGGRSLLPPDRQATAQAGDRDRHPVPPAADRAVRGRGRRRKAVPTSSSSESSPTRGRAWPSRPRSPARGGGCRRSAWTSATAPRSPSRRPRPTSGCCSTSMLGDPTLFTRTDEVESAWRFITAILDAWQQPDAPPPATYVAGSWGPEAADAFIAADGARWRWL